MLDTERPDTIGVDLMGEGAPSVTRLLGSTKDILTSLDLGSLLTRLAAALGSFVRIDGLSLNLSDVSEELLLLRRGDSFKQEMVYGSLITSPTSFAWDALAGGVPRVLRNLDQRQDVTFPSYVPREGFKSLIAVPLISGSHRIGLVTIFLKGSADVSSDVLAIISIVASATAGAIENSELVRRIEKNYFSTVEALAAAIEVKDPYTRGHSKRVTQYAIVLAERFGVSQADVTNLQYGATLHDIGKIGISEAILNKPGKLNPEEFDVIRKHPVIGDHIIERVDFLQGSRPVVRAHHERFDGTGYPDGLKDEDIPFLARIVAVVDFFDALTSDRPYRKAFSVDQTCLMIREGIGREFDPMVAKEFLAISSSLAKTRQVPVAIPALNGL
jgi:putative nucleotidyltransferase with HDIG domain